MDASYRHGKKIKPDTSSVPDFNDYKTSENCAYVPSGISWRIARLYRFPDGLYPRSQQ